MTNDEQDELNRMLDHTAPRDIVNELVERVNDTNVLTLTFSEGYTLHVVDRAPSGESAMVLIRKAPNGTATAIVEKAIMHAGRHLVTAHAKTIAERHQRDMLIFNKLGKLTCMTLETLPEPGQAPKPSKKVVWTG